LKYRYLIKAFLVRATLTCRAPNAPASERKKLILIIINSLRQMLLSI
jgi:hypothetical protein